MLTTISVANNAQVTTITLPVDSTISAYKIGSLGIAINQGATFPAALAGSGSYITIQNVRMDGGTTGTLTFGNHMGATGWYTSLDAYRPLVCPATGITTISGNWSATTTFTVRARYEKVPK